MKNICIISTSAGEGHRSAEKAIRKILNGSQYDIVTYDIYKDILNKYDILNMLFGISAPDIYNEFILKRGKSGVVWLILSAFLIITIFLRRRGIIASISNFFKKYEFDLVISVVPFMNGVLHRGIKRIDKKTQFITLMLDFEEPSRNIWFQDKNQLVVVNTRRAYEQALNFGINKNNIHLLSGAIISPDYYDAEYNSDIISTISQKLDKDRKTVLMLFGGYGPNRMLNYAHVLEKSQLPIQLIYVCGRNRELFNYIRKLPSSKPRVVYEFIENLIPLYAVADLLIGKPGPGTITEAVHMNVPLLVEKNKATLIQERYNAKWILGKKVGQLFANETELIREVHNLIAGNKSVQYKKNARLINNTGIFEMKNIINDLVA